MERAVDFFSPEAGGAREIKDLSPEEKEIKLFDLLEDKISLARSRGKNKREPVDLVRKRLVDLYNQKCVEWEIKPSADKIVGFLQQKGWLRKI